MRLHKNQLPRLPGSGLKCNQIVVVVVWCGLVFLPIIIPLQPNCFVLFCVVGRVVAITGKSHTSQKIIEPQIQVGRKKNILSSPAPPPGLLVGVIFFDFF
jgi:hypothetical protein